jgi:hypothetical protein
MVQAIRRIEVVIAPRLGGGLITVVARLGLSAELWLRSPGPLMLRPALHPAARWRPAVRVQARGLPEARAAQAVCSR